MRESRDGSSPRREGLRFVRRLDTGTDPASLWVLMEKYVEAMEVRGMAPYTCKARRQCVTAFIHWAEERGLSRADEITKPILEQYQRWLFRYRKEKSGAPLTYHTQCGLLVSVRTFFKWLARHNHLLYNPASEIELPKKPSALPADVFSADEAEKILAQPDVTNPYGLRDRAILELLYSTGIRRSELIRLKLYDVDLSRNIVLVREGKGRKDRIIPLGTRAAAWVNKYLTDSRHVFAFDPQAKALFLSQRGTSLSTSKMAELATKYIRGSGVREKGGCHLFRHTAATLMLEGGADTRFIQQMLGHRSLESTQIYTRVSVKKLKEVHSATHPGARLEPRKEHPEENPADHDFPDPEEKPE